ncbi:MAG: porin family protein [Alphaproteobacteria bacterium]|nr:porin family protein [Alphaproteobacteria bacterium]
MNTKKVLSAVALTAAATTQWAVASPSESSGFYAGANMGTQTYDFSEKTRGTNGAEEEDGEKYKKTKPLAELLVGYDRKLENFKLGIELLAGTVIGKMKHRARDVEAPEYDITTAKTPWCISLMPRIGYMITPKFELYGTFGVRVENVRLDMRVGVYRGGEVKIKSCRTHIQPLVGLGTRYEISNRVFAKLEYNYGFDTHLKLRFGKVLYRNRLQAHTAKLGFGVRF